MGKKNKTELSVEIGKRIKHIQNELGYKNKEMAEEIKVSADSYKGYCRGDVLIPTSVCINLIRTFAVNPSYLFLGDVSRGIFMDESIQYDARDLLMVLSTMDDIFNSLKNLPTEERNEGMRYILKSLSEVI